MHLVLPRGYSLIKIILVLSKSGPGLNNIFPWNIQNFPNNAFLPCIFDFVVAKPNETFKDKLIIYCSFRKCIGVMFLLVPVGIFLIEGKYR